MGIKGEWDAFCFDEVVVMFGTAFRSAVEKARKESKSDNAFQLQVQQIANRWAGATQQYKEPGR